MSGRWDENKKTGVRGLVFTMTGGRFFTMLSMAATIGALGSYVIMDLLGICN